MVPFSSIIAKWEANPSRGHCWQTAVVTSDTSRKHKIYITRLTCSKWTPTCQGAIINVPLPSISPTFQIKSQWRTLSRIEPTERCRFSILQLQVTQARNKLAIRGNEDDRRGGRNTSRNQHGNGGSGKRWWRRRARKELLKNQNQSAGATN